MKGEEKKKEIPVTSSMNSPGGDFKRKSLEILMISSVETSPMG